MKGKHSLLASLLLLTSSVIAAAEKPNVVVIYTDDLGIGDVSAYNMGTLKTPNIDNIAEQGILFNQGYATAATCTPSRFSLLTGQYPWRKGAQILPGDAPLLISPDQETLPKMFSRAGYKTAVIGKWHLGLGRGEVDWNKHIELNPNAVGFDYSYIMAATNDRVPNVYVENGLVQGLDANDPLYVSYQQNFEGEPTGLDNPELLTKMKFSNGHYHSVNNGISRIGFQKGGKAAQWIDEDMSDLFLNKAKEYVSEHKSEPFFLFYTLHQPHVPRVPHPRFNGKSGLGPRGDTILEADWAVGDFMQHLKQLGLADNTIVIFSSDNGPVLDDGYVDQSVELNGDHTPWGKYRGGKYSLFDSGAHVPFMIQWPKQIKPTTSDALVSQHDLLASLAALINQDADNGDSQNTLSSFLGTSQQGRKNLIVQALYGRTALRQDNWMFIPAYWGPETLEKENVETGACSCYQLYDLKTDPGQQHNLADKYPEKTKQMLATYNKIRFGR